MKEGKKPLCSYKKTDFSWGIEEEHVFKMLQCPMMAQGAEEAGQELKEVLPFLKQKIKPAAFLSFGELNQDGSYPEKGKRGDLGKVILCFMSIGGEVEEWISKLFTEGAYLKGLVADAAADVYLFQMQDQLEKDLKKLCRQQGCGIKKRLDSPDGIPIQVQKTIFDRTGAGQEGFSINSSYMFKPLKSCAQVYLLGEGAEFSVRHSCSNCTKKDCLFREKEKV